MAAKTRRNRLGKNSILLEKLSYIFLCALHVDADCIVGLSIDNLVELYFDRQYGELTYGRWFPYGGDRNYLTAVVQENVTYYIPFRAKKLVTYDRLEKMWNEVDLKIDKTLDPKEEMKKTEISNNLPGRFLGGCFYKDCVYLFPFGYRGIIKYDTKTGEAVHCVNFQETILKNDVALFHNYVWMDDTHIALSCLYSNHVVIFNMENNEIEIKKVGKTGDRFTSIIKYEKSYWLIVKNRLAFIKWDICSGAEKELSSFPATCKIVNAKHCFDDSNIYVYGQFLYCFPASCNMAVRLDLTNGTIVELMSLHQYSQNENLDRRWSTFDFGIRVGDNVYLQYQLDSLLVFDLKTEKVQEYDKKIRDIGSIQRLREDSFKFFFNSIKKREKIDTQDNDKLKDSVGKAIYAAASGLIV